MCSNHIHPVYIDETGTIISRYQNVPVPENLCVLIDTETSTYHGFGSKNILEQKFANLLQFPGIVLIELSTDKLTSKQKAYIICRMAEYSATSFPKDFAEQITKPDFTQWLTYEMQRVPIDVCRKGA